MAHPDPNTIFVVPDEFASQVRDRARVPFDEARQMRYLYELRKHGRAYIAAELAGVTQSRVAYFAKSNPEFAVACEEARQAYVDEILITEAQRRAVDGVERPIIGGKFRDEVVAHEVIYSDGLLKMLIQGRRPEYREGPSAEAGKFNQEAGGVLVIPVGTKTVDDWEQAFGQGEEPPK